MKKLLLILLCLPMIGLGQCENGIPITLNGIDAYGDTWNGAIVNIMDGDNQIIYSYNSDDYNWGCHVVMIFGIGKADNNGIYGERFRVSEELVIKEV